MPIYAPGKRINPTIRRKGLAGRKEVSAGLFLTSMVDMFAILVIFLLQSFSAEGEIIVLKPGMELPKASNIGTLEIAPVVTVSRDVIELEGKEIAKTAELAAQTEWANVPMQDAFKELKAKLEGEARKKAADAGQPLAEGEPIKLDAKINISADRRLYFQVVKKIMYNASFAGFPDFRFAVLSKSQSEVLVPPAQ